MHRFLLVDDNRAFADNVAEILRDCGDEVVVCSDAWAAVALATSTRFDGLITDMRMPGMSGAALLRELRRLGCALPAIVISAYTSEEELELARREGPVAVFQKPVPISQLLAELERLPSRAAR